jgi:guanine deaminase
MMRAAADLAREHQTYVQTHLAENREEVEKVKHQFAWAADYTDIYDKCGLLGPKTVLGHCLHLSEREGSTTSRRRPCCRAQDAGCTHSRG